MSTHSADGWSDQPPRADLAELGIEFNVVSNDEHVPEIKQQIHMVKE